MAERSITLLLPVTLFTVLALVSPADKEGKINEGEKLSACLHQVTEQNSIMPGYKKQLVHQRERVDEKNRMRLFIDKKNSVLSPGTVHPDGIKSKNILPLRQVVTPGENSHNPEAANKRTRFAMVPGKAGTEKNPTLYETVEYRMAGFEK